MLKNSMNEVQGLMKLVLLTLNKPKTVKAMTIIKVDPLIPTLHAADKKPFTIIFPQHDFLLVKLLIHLKGLCLYQKLKNANYLQGMLNLLGTVSYI